MPCRSGFTLIEVVASLTIIGVVSAAVLGSAAEELRAARRTAASIEAAALVEDLLFRVEYGAWDSLTFGGDLRAGRYRPPLDRYGWSVHVRPGPAGSGLAEATARVAWEDGEFVAITRFAPPRAGAADSSQTR